MPHNDPIEPGHEPDPGQENTYYGAFISLGPVTISRLMDAYGNNYTTLGLGWSLSPVPFNVGVFEGEIWSRDQNDNYLPLSNDQVREALGGWDIGSNASLITHAAVDSNVTFPTGSVLPNVDLFSEGANTNLAVETGWALVPELGIGEISFTMPDLLPAEHHEDLISSASNFEEYAAARGYNFGLPPTEESETYLQFLEDEYRIDTGLEPTILGPSGLGLSENMNLEQEFLIELALGASSPEDFYHSIIENPHIDQVFESPSHLTETYNSLVSEGLAGIRDRDAERLQAMANRWDVIQSSEEFAQAMQGIPTILQSFGDELMDAGSSVADIRAELEFMAAAMGGGKSGGGGDDKKKRDDKPQSGISLPPSFLPPEEDDDGGPPPVVKSGGGVVSAGKKLALQHGGIAPGGLALVGEAGPELVTLPGGSHVSPNSLTQSLLGGGMGQGRTINHVTVDIEGVTDSQELVRELRRELRMQGLDFAEIN